MCKKILSILTSAALLLCLLSISAAADSVLTGNGTELNPFVAANETQLRMLADFPDAYWKLSNDIELTAAWEPVSEFFGTLDGNGYKVSGISISDSEGSWPNESAFFKINKGTIKNLILDGEVDYSSSHLGGAIFVYENYGHISGCAVSGTAKLYLSNAYSQSSSQFGGFASLNYSGGVIENCYSRITIKGTYSGGSLNYLSNSMGFINTNQEGGIIRSCYSASSPSSGQMSQTIRASFCGSSSGSIESCFYDKDLCGYTEEYNHKGIPKTTAAMQMQQTYSDWDFDSVWAIDESINDGYPYLQTEKSITIHPAELVLNRTSATISEGNTITLCPIFTPSNTSNKNVAWTTSNRYVASVDANGVVTGVSAGTATITVTAEDGAYSAECAITVTAAAQYSYAINSLAVENVGNNGMRVRANISKISEHDDIDAVVIALYDANGAILDSIFMEGQFATGQTVNFGGYLNGDGGEIIKVFVWDSIDNMIPLSEAYK